MTNVILDFQKARAMQSESKVVTCRGMPKPQKDRQTWARWFTSFVCFLPINLGSERLRFPHKEVDSSFLIHRVVVRVK